MTFGYRHNPELSNGIKIHQSVYCISPCSCPVISQSSAIRYLGATLEPKLTWHQHIDNLLIKLQSANYQMFHLAKLIPRAHAIRAYKALYEPLLRFASLHWGNTFKVHFDKILIMQKKVIRAITGIKPWESSKPWFEEFKLLNVHKLVFVEMVGFGHRNRSALGQWGESDGNSYALVKLAPIIIKLTWFNLAQNSLMSNRTESWY